MKNQRKQFSLSAVVFIVAVFAVTLSGCGGQTMVATNATPTPSPAPTATPGNTPSNAQTISSVQNMAGWQSCTTCTGSALAVFSLKQGVATPSLSGSAAQFQMLTGTHPFGGALWFEFLGAHDNASHFVYDFFFYVDNPSAAQAIEFNVSQSDGTNRYSFNTQCDLAGSKTWRVWDPVGSKWVASSVGCAEPPAKTWTHVVWEFEHDSSGNVIFEAVTVNGTRGVVNMSMAHTADTEHGLDIAYQSDANLNGTPYSVYLDKVNLTYW